MARPPVDEKSRFIKFVKEVDSGCHEWQSTISNGGYGKFYFRGKQDIAHRVAYQLLIGDIPEGMNVLHTCDNRKCVNPLHLYAGTQAQNVADKIERCAWYGRMKYSYEVIEECRRLYAQGVTQTELSKRFGIGQTSISKYVLNKQRIKK